MADQRGQADKKAAEDKTAEQQQDEAKSAAAKVVGAEDVGGDPYPAYDLMTLEQLRSLAKERDVELNRDVEKAHLVSELRAADTHTR